MITCMLAGMTLTNPEEGIAASGGRIGGGSFNAPSMPRTRGYGGSSGGYGGYRGGYGGYRGGGIGFPFILPFFGFGGGGLFGFLILMAIIGVIGNALRGANISSEINQREITSTNPKSIALIQLQIGLLASAKDLQKDLRHLANSADTKTSKGCK